MASTVKSLTVPTAEEAQRIVYNTRVRTGNQAIVQTGATLACVLIEIGSQVEAADYESLMADIAKVAGIETATILIDAETPATIPAGTELRMCVEAQLRIDNVRAVEAEPPREL